MNSGRTLEEIKRLFNYLEENKTNDDLQIIMTTECCHGLYELFIDCSKYQKILETRINKAIEYIEEKWYEKNTMDINSVVSTGDIRIDILKILSGGKNE